MSSTKRGSSRASLDVYPTPAWCVQRLLERVDLPGEEWLDPCAGDGAIVRAVRACRHDVKWTAVEIREDCRHLLRREVPGDRVLIGDFLSLELPVAPRVVIGDPPYSLATEFIQRSLDLADTVAFLLRLNYLASAKRAEDARTRAADVYVLPNRPSFTGGKTDSCEYAWFVWKREELPRRTGHVSVLAITSLEERARLS